MRCPNCDELLKDDAKICFSCGKDLKEHAIDSLFQEMIDEDSVQTPANSGNINGSNKSKSKTRVSNTNNVKDSDGSQAPKGEKVVYGQAFRITAVITVLFVIGAALSLLMNWFSLAGRGSYLGFVDDQSKNYKTSEVIGLSTEAINELDASVAILKFSPKTLYRYAKDTTEIYSMLPDNNGMTKKSWSVIIEQIYIKGFFLIPIMCILSVLALLFDRRFYLIELVRGFSLITILITLLNFLALKITFFSMFAIRAKALLQLDNKLNRVTMNLNGINLNNDFYPYKLVENKGFYIALIACSVWFVLTTVLIEMKKDKNKQYG